MAANDVDLTKTEDLEFLDRKQRATLKAMALTGTTPLPVLQIMVARGFREFLRVTKQAYAGEGFRSEDYDAIWNAVKTFTARHTAAAKLRAKA